MRFHSHFLSIETLLSGASVCTPKNLGLTLAGEFATRTKFSPYGTGLVGSFATHIEKLTKLTNLTNLAGLPSDPPFSTTAAGMLELFRTLLHEKEHLEVLCRDSREVENLHRLLASPKISHTASPSFPEAAPHRYPSPTLNNALKLRTIPYNDVWIRDTGPLFLTPLPSDNNVSDNNISDNNKKSNPISEPRKRGRRGGAVIFRFNGWGEKYAHERDAALAKEFIQQLRYGGALDSYEDFFLFETDLSCEGGALESNGRGVALTTRSVILSPNRGNRTKHGKNGVKTNTSRFLDREETEHLLKELLGLHTLLGLEQGLMEDDTDGHIDNVARFITDQTVLVASPPRPEWASAGCSELTSEQLEKENHLRKILTANQVYLEAYSDAHSDTHSANYSSTNAEPNVRSRARLKGASAVSRDSTKLQVLSLPLPPPTYIQKTDEQEKSGNSSNPGKRLTQSYLNYLQLKDKILMPSYDSVYEKALAPLLREIFPEHEVVWIDWREAIAEGGGPHCLTLHLPF